MQITEQLIERIARNVFQQMFMQQLLNANVVRGDSIKYADESERLGDQTIGSITKFLYLDQGTPKASNANVGDASHPVYVNNGVITPFTDEMATKGDISSINGEISDINDDIGDINSAISGINGEISDIWDAIHALQPSQ